MSGNAAPTSAWYRAATLNERLVAPRAGTDPEGEQHCEEWRSHPVFAGNGMFERRLAMAGYRIAVDGRARDGAVRLYVGGFDPRSVSERPRAKGHGEIHVYRIK